MFEKQLIKTYLKLSEEHPKGWKRGFLGITKKAIKQILEYELKGKIGNIDLLTRSEEDQIKGAIFNIGNISIAEFFQYHQNRKTLIIQKVLDNMITINIERTNILFKKGENIITDLESNITDEQSIVDFLTGVKEYLKCSLAEKEDTERKLWSMIKREEIAKELTGGEITMKQDLEHFKKDLSSEETEKQTLEVLKNSCAFIYQLDEKIAKSYNLLITAIESNNFKYARRILETWEYTMNSKGLSRFYTMMMHYINYLEKSKGNIQTDNIKKVIEETAIDIYNQKDTYIAKNTVSIANENIHYSVVDRFQDVCKLVKNLVTYSRIEDLKSSHKDIAKYLFMTKTIDKFTYKTIVNNDYVVPVDDIQKLAQQLFEQIMEKSEIAVEKDETERLKIEAKRLKVDAKSKKEGPNLGQKILRGISDGLGYLWHTLLQFTKTLKGVPKAILMSIIITVVVIVKIIKWIASQITSIFGLLKRKSSEGSDDKQEENNEDNGKERENERDGKLFESEMLEKLMNIMRSQGMRDLLNNVFSGDLLAMGEKENNLRHERNLLDHGNDTLQRVEIRNYEKLDSILLVGEVSFCLEETRWAKETINHANQHTLESNKSGEYKQDYSFFLDQNKWEMEKLENDQEYPTLILRKGSFTKGINSIVCPRGYIPVLSNDTKNLFDEQGIEYKLYCIKNLGYYYLKLDKVPDGVIDIHYVRYGDNDYNGIFFNTTDNQGVSGYLDIEEKLVKKILDTSNLPENIQNIVNEQSKIQDKIELCQHSTSYLANNFLYSKEKRNTTEQYLKHPSYVSGIAQIGIGDCKNVNTLNIGLLREQNIQAQKCAGYVKGEDKYEGHGITEVNIDTKCLLLDATPNKQAPGKTTKTKEKKEKMSENVSLAKTFLAEVLENFRNRYKKWIKYLEKHDKINESLTIEKNIKRGEDRIKNSLEDYNDKEYGKLLMSHLENLIDKKILIYLPPAEKKSFLAEHYKRLANIEIFTHYLYLSEDNNADEGLPISEAKRSIISDLSKIYEYNQQVLETLKHINEKLGTNISISTLNEKIIKDKMFGNKSISNDEAAENMANEVLQSNVSTSNPLFISLVRIIKLYLDKVFDLQILPYDIVKVVDINSSQFYLYRERFFENETNQNIEHKKDVLPSKVKKTILGQLKSIKIDLEKEAYKRYSNQIRIIILSMLDEVYKELDTIDDSVWIGRPEKKLKNIYEGISTWDDMKRGYRLDHLPMDVSYKLHSLMLVIKNFGRSKNIEEHIKSNEQWKTEYEILLNVIGGEYSSKFSNDYYKIDFLKLLEKHRNADNYRLLNLLLYNFKRGRKKDDTYNCMRLGEMEIKRDQMLDEMIPFLEEKLLLKYKDNPLAILDFISSKTELNPGDRNVIKSNLMKICATSEHSSQEKLVVEKSIFSVMDMVLNQSSGFNEDLYGGIGELYKPLGGYRQPNIYGQSGLSYLKELLSMISSDQIVNLIQRAYSVFYLEEKKYRKGESNNRDEDGVYEEVKISGKQKLRNIKRIIKVLIERLQDYTLQNKRELQTTLLEFKMNQLSKRIDKYLYGGRNRF